MKQLSFSFAKTPIESAVDQAYLEECEFRGSAESIPMYAVVDGAARILLHNSFLDVSYFMRLEEQVRDYLRNNPYYYLVRGKGGGVFKYDSKAA